MVLSGEREACDLQACLGVRLGVYFLRHVNGVHYAQGSAVGRDGFAVEGWMCCRRCEAKFFGFFLSLILQGFAGFWGVKNRVHYLKVDFEGLRVIGIGSVLGVCSVGVGANKSVRHGNMANLIATCLIASWLRLHCSHGEDVNDGATQRKDLQGAEV